MIEVKVSQIPNCDICNDVPTPAYADAMIPLFATWGYVCENHYKQFGCKVGLGYGQLLVKDVE
jgi:hypothetical protein